MRCFLGPESVRADNALALAAEAGRFDELRHELFAHQPEEGTGGFTIDDLLELGARVGLHDRTFISGVRQARYEQWVLSRGTRFAREDPQGTPAAWLNGRRIDPRLLFESSGVRSATAVLTARTALTGAATVRSLGPTVTYWAFTTGANGETSGRPRPHCSHVGRDPVGAASKIPVQNPNIVAD